MTTTREPETVEFNQSHVPVPNYAQACVALERNLTPAEYEDYCVKYQEFAKQRYDHFQAIRTV